MIERGVSRIDGVEAAKEEEVQIVTTSSSSDLNPTPTTTIDSSSSYSVSSPHYCCCIHCSRCVRTCDIYSSGVSYSRIGKLGGERSKEIQDEDLPILILTWQ